MVSSSAYETSLTSAIIIVIKINQRDDDVCLFEP